MITQKGKNVTYLLGAGASYSALPVLDQIESRMKQLKEKIDDGQIEVNHSELITKDLRWILGKSRNYFTVDTLARKFFIQNQHNNLNRLKRGLSAFFVLEQFRNKTNEEGNMVDLRYINFLAANTIETDYHYETIELAKNINVITWNYDIQMELAFKILLTGEDSKLEHSDNMINIEYNENDEDDQIEYKRKKEAEEENRKKTFIKLVTENMPTYPFTKIYHKDKIPQMIHLNGIAGGFGNKDRYASDENTKYINFINIDEKYDFEKPDEIPNDLIDDLYNEKNTCDTLFTYSWEEKGTVNAIAQANQIMNKTEVLVIVGYSFPFFNRTADKTLFANFLNIKDYPRKKPLIIYYQEPNEQIDERTLIDKFGIPDEVDVRMIRNVKEFQRM